MSEYKFYTCDSNVWRAIAAPDLNEFQISLRASLAYLRPALPGHAGC